MYEKWYLDFGRSNVIKLSHKNIPDIYDIMSDINGRARFNSMFFNILFASLRCTFNYKVQWVLLNGKSQITLSNLMYAHVLIIISRLFQVHLLIFISRLFQVHLLIIISRLLKSISLCHKLVS